jgi:SAM-dependent methyltransferase
MAADPDTLAFYDREAPVYADYAEKTAEHPWLQKFAALLAPGARALDFGCGSGWAAQALTEQGFKVAALDGSAGLAAQALQRYGIPVRVARFEEFNDTEAFEGIWVSFSLLHDSREAMPEHMARLHRGLVPGGWLYLGLKEGTGGLRDKLGRRYTYYSADEITGLLQAAGFPDPEINRRAASEGYDGSTTGVLHIFAQREP